jgi:peroxiredoxin (alkyl hydroperoxide reductase subunit C)
LGQLNYPLISDSNQKLLIVILTNDGLSFPGVFIIDKEGIIQYYTVNNLLCGRSVDELLRILQSIQYIKRIRAKLAQLIGNMEIKFCILIL